MMYPPPRDDLEAFLQKIENELKGGEYDLLLPTQEATVKAIVKHKSRFDKHTNVPFLPYEKLLVGIDKRRTIEAARKFDVPHPKTLLPDEISSEAVEDGLGYPVVVKPIYGTGRKGVSICDSYQELKRVVSKTEAEHGTVLLQEFIPNGGERGVYTLYDCDGELTALTVQQRLRSNPPDGGASTYRETVEDPALVSLSDEFLTGLNWRGLAMVEFRIDSRTGEPQLMEINPRLWGSLALSVYAGVDFPYLLYQLAIGEHVEPDLEYDVGVRARCLFEDFLQVLQRDDPPQAVREFLTPSSRPCCHDIVSVRDPLPAVGQIAYWFTILYEDGRSALAVTNTDASESEPKELLDS